MTPNEIVRTAFESSITPLLEPVGFSYSRSQFTYKRKKGDFIQHIPITLSHNNTQDNIHFWSHFNVSCPRYNRWLREKGRTEELRYVGGCADWNVPGWDEPGEHSIHFDFSDPQSRSRVLSEWQRRCFATGIPYLDSLSSWEGAAEDLIRWRWHYERAADLFLMAGMNDKAIAALEAGIASVKKEALLVPPTAHHILVVKREREAQERKKTLAAFQQRIETIKNSEQDAAPNAPSNGNSSTVVVPARIRRQPARWKEK